MSCTWAAFPMHVASGQKRRYVALMLSAADRNRQLGSKNMCWLSANPGICEPSLSFLPSNITSIACKTCLAAMRQALLLPAHLVYIYFL